ncbi:MAG: NAD-dependent epimerase/dehydratase family protein [Anaerolineae bacterium]
MLACVTGGTGFVGSYVVRALLADGHQVRVLHRPHSKLNALAGLAYQSAQGDVTDADSLAQAFADCDWVFHVAAVADYWRADPTHLFRVNVDGTQQVLQAAQQAQVKRVVFTSSAAAVGLPDDDAPSDETVPFNLRPQDFPYGYSKVQAEALVQQFVADGLDVVTVNPSVVIGAGDLNMISGSYIMQVAQWQWLVPRTAGGIAVSDVRDIADSHLAAAKHGRTGERYLLNTANYSNVDWFSMIADVVGVVPPLLPLPAFLTPLIVGGINGLRRLGIETVISADQARLGSRYVYFDASKAHRELHQPRIDMRESVEATYRWYREHGYLEETRWTRWLNRIGRLWHRR